MIVKISMEVDFHDSDLRKDFEASSKYRRMLILLDIADAAPELVTFIEQEGAPSVREPN